MTRVGPVQSPASSKERGRRGHLRAGGRLEGARLLAWRGRRASKGAQGASEKSSKQILPRRLRRTGPASTLTLAPQDHAGLLSSRTVRECTCGDLLQREGEADAEGASRRPGERMLPLGFPSRWGDGGRQPVGAAGASHGSRGQSLNWRAACLVP